METRRCCEKVSICVFSISIFFFFFNFMIHYFNVCNDDGRSIKSTSPSLLSCFFLSTGAINGDSCDISQANLSRAKAKADTCLRHHPLELKRPDRTRH